MPPMMRAGLTPPNKGKRYPAEVLEPAEVQVLLDQLSRKSATGDPEPRPGGPARSAIEIVAGAWWLMEPRLGVRARVCREAALSLTSARRAGQLADEFRATGYEVSDAIEEAGQQEARVLERIAALGLSISVTSKPLSRSTIYTGPGGPAARGTTRRGRIPAVGSPGRVGLPAGKPAELSGIMAHYL